MAEDIVQWPYDADPMANNEVSEGTRIMAANENDEDKMASVTVGQVAERAAAQVELVGIELEPLEGGEAEGQATEVGPGPQTGNRKAEASPGWYDFGSGPVEAATGRRWIAWWDGGQQEWSLRDMGPIPDITLDAEIEDGDERGVTGDRVYNKVAVPIGLEFKEPGHNILEHLNPLDVDDTSKWGTGFYQEDGTIGTGGWANTLIKASKGTYQTNNYIAGLASYVMFDRDMNVVGSYTNKGNVTGTVEWEIDMPVDGFIGISQGRNPNLYRDPFYAYADQETPVATGQVFVLQTELEGRVKDTFREEMSDTYGVNPSPVGINFAEELSQSSLGNENIWARGFLREDGSTENAPNFYHTREYLPLNKGAYEFYFWFSGNARAIIYNRDFTIQQTIARGSGGDGFEGTFSIQQDSYIRFSHRQSETQPARLPSVYIRNTEELIPTIVTTDNIKEYAQTSNTTIRTIWRDQNRPKKKRPMVTLISDDLHQRNADWYVPLLDEYDVKSTFAVIGDRTMAAGQGDENGYLPPSYVKQLYKEGHNIASHTWTHGHMNQMTPEDIDEELSRTKIYLEQFVDVPVNMFISPFGERSRTIDNIVARYYDANFISGYGSLNPPPIDSYFLNRVSFDAAEANRRLMWEERLKPAIDEAIAENNWLIFAVHPQYTQYYSGFAQYMERRNEMRLLIEYCQANGVEILTADKAFNYWKNDQEIGVSSYDAKYYKLGMDGSEINAGYFEE